MAFKYGTTKFDAKSKKVDDSGAKGIAIPLEVVRRVMKGIANRVIGDTAGTGANIKLAGLTGGAASGGKIANLVILRINGQYSTCIVQDNIPMPDGVSLGTNTVCKFLVYSGAGTSGSITGPGNIIDKGDYATVALAAAAAKLPDLPDGNYCALGQILVHAPAASAISYLRTGTLSTMGTISYTDFVHMPYDGS